MTTNPTARPFIAGFSTLALAVGNAAAAHGDLLISIPPGHAAQTLNEWATQTHIQLLDDPEQLQHWRTRGVAATLPPLEALGMMLRDTPFTYRVVNSHTVVVIPGTQYCQPWLSAAYAPLPPCVQMPAALQGARL